LLNVSSDDNGFGRRYHGRFGFATLISPEHHSHRRTECQVGCEDRSSEVPSKVHAENSNAQPLDYGTDKETDTQSGSVGYGPPNWQVETPECEDDSETGAIPKMISKPAESGRNGWAQSEAVEQKHAHQFRKVAGHESHPKLGVSDSHKRHGRQRARDGAVADQGS
jgi:hypothetical protein